MKRFVSTKIKHFFLNSMKEIKSVFQEDWNNLFYINVLASYLLPSPSSKSVSSSFKKWDYLSILDCNIHVQASFNCQTTVYYGLVHLCPPNWKTHIQFHLKKQVFAKVLGPSQLYNTLLPYASTAKVLLYFLSFNSLKILTFHL